MMSAPNAAIRVAMACPMAPIPMIATRGPLQDRHGSRILSRSQWRPRPSVLPPVAADAADPGSVPAHVRQPSRPRARLPWRSGHHPECRSEATGHSRSIPPAPRPGPVTGRSIRPDGHCRTRCRARRLSRRATAAQRCPRHPPGQGRCPMHRRRRMSVPGLHVGQEGDQSHPVTSTAGGRDIPSSSAGRCRSGG